MSKCFPKRITLLGREVNAIGSELSPLAVNNTVDNKANRMPNLALVKRGYLEYMFLISQQKTYVVGSCKEHLSGGTSNVYHSVCFCGEIRKISTIFG